MIEFDMLVSLVKSAHTGHVHVEMQTTDGYQNHMKYTCPIDQAPRAGKRVKVVVGGHDG